nr:MAG TPA: hypothetical protein [Caudoviricetes sp.]
MELGILVLIALLLLLLVLGGQTHSISQPGEISCSLLHCGSRGGFQGLFDGPCGSFFFFGHIQSPFCCVLIRFVIRFSYLSPWESGTGRGPLGGRRWPESNRPRSP